MNPSPVNQECRRVNCDIKLAWLVWKIKKPSPFRTKGEGNDATQSGFYKSAARVEIFSCRRAT
ncbi:MAG: hypothetical protein WHX52_23435, partial [Anaerolineae bacterium]